jgi:hypothetical protein
LRLHDEISVAIGTIQLTVVADVNQETKLKGEMIKTLMVLHRKALDETEIERQNVLKFRKIKDEAIGQLELLVAEKEAYRRDMLTKVTLTLHTRPNFTYYLNVH